ncbi:MAG: amino acid permease [Planctomycetota bacterium]|nr:amino acid permease [Planctomycetota bacterium]
MPSKNLPTPASARNQPRLVRALGPRIAIAVVVGNVIGSGIFLKPGAIADATGDFRVILAMWITGGVLCILGGLCFAELASMFPQAGGLYVYLREAYGKPVAFLCGWNIVLFGTPASCAALAVAFIGSFANAIGWDPSLFAEIGMAVVMIGSMALVNILGVVWGGRLQMIFTLVKAGFLGLVALTPFVLLPVLETSVEWTNYSSRIEPHYPSLAGQIGTVLLAVMWAYNGWHGVTPLAEEVRDPQRNIPFALLGGIGILITLYLAANLAYHGVLSMEEMRAAGDHVAERMVGKLLGPSGAAAISVVIMCSTFGAINTNLLTVPRTSFAMGRDRVFFSALGRVHEKFHTPAAAIAVMAGMAILLIVCAGVGKHWVSEAQATPANSSAAGGNAERMETGTATAEAAPKSNNERLWSRILDSLRNDSLFALFTNFVIFSASIFYALGVAAVVVLRIRRPDLARPYRTFAYPWVPLAFLLVYIWFLGQIYLTNPLESRMGLVIIALGLPVYWMYRKLQSPPPEHADA